VAEECDVRMRGKGGIKQTAQTSSPSTERHGGQEVNRKDHLRKKSNGRNSTISIHKSLHEMVAASFRLENERKSQTIVLTSHQESHALKKYSKKKYKMTQI
jgi:hypothetical protein